ENSLSAKVSCWLIRLLILGSGYNTMISHLGLIRTFLNYDCTSSQPIILYAVTQQYIIWQMKNGVRNPPFRTGFDQILNSPPLFAKGSCD
ncbi:hypothetical protein AB8Q34_28470, partial [Klebsiella quasipneumoniae subsp. similipneumoniae]